MCPNPSPDRWLVFLFPWRGVYPDPFTCDAEVVKKAIILEEVNGGTNKWGCQLGHIRAAQMNGVGQHVFFSDLDADLFF